MRSWGQASVQACLAQSLGEEWLRPRSQGIPVFPMGDGHCLGPAGREGLAESRPLATGGLSRAEGSLACGWDRAGIPVLPDRPWAFSLVSPVLRAQQKAALLPLPHGIA